MAQQALMSAVETFKIPANLPESQQEIQLGHFYEIKEKPHGGAVKEAYMGNYTIDFQPTGKRDVAHDVHVEVVLKNTTAGKCRVTNPLLWNTDFETHTGQFNGIVQRILDEHNFERFYGQYSFQDLQKWHQLLWLDKEYPIDTVPFRFQNEVRTFHIPLTNNIFSCVPSGYFLGRLGRT